MNETESIPPKSAVRRGRPPKAIAKPTETPTPAPPPAPTTETETEAESQPVRHRPPAELPPDKQLENVMAQIAAVTGAPVVTDSTPQPPAMPILPKPPAQPPQPRHHSAPEAEGIKPHDVVQIMRPENRLYGILFIVGDVDGRRVHGFYMQPGGKKEFVTVDVGELIGKGRLAIIGESRVRSKAPCSSKWYADHGKPNNL